MDQLYINQNQSSLLVYEHFQSRVNREGHLFGTIDGSQIIFNTHQPKPSHLRRFHINFYTFSKLFEMLNGKQNLRFVETGTSANAVDSTSLLDQWIRHFGGDLTTIDIDPSRKLTGQSKWCSNTEAIVSDSVSYLKEWTQHHEGKTIDVVYLDSWDVEWTNAEASQIHGLREFEAVIPYLSEEAFIMIDDTPLSPEWLPERGENYYYVSVLVNGGSIVPGKGTYIKEKIKSDPRFKIITHQYQLLIHYDANRTDF